MLSQLQKQLQTGNQNYLRKLPLLDFTVALFPRVDLRDVYIICAQHIVSTTYSLFHILLELGLNPVNLSVIGKCYSTDPQAYEEMKKLNIDVCSSSLLFQSHISFDAQYKENIQAFIKKRIKKIIKWKFKKIIILDDGGELISQIHDLLTEKNQIIGIEQTSSGFHRLEKKNLIIPVINVARSFAKLYYESPVIARLVVNSLINQIKKFEIVPNQVLIIGNGAIGSSIFEVLKPQYPISIFDKIISKSSMDHRELRRVLKNFDLIIGCTGKPMLKSEHYSLLNDKAVLVSASSSDREFNAVHLRNRIPITRDCHENLFVEGRLLVNCGFPVNFSNDYREIDSDDLQLTRSLLLAAVLQGCYEVEFVENGFISLNIEKQKDIIRKYVSIFKLNN